MGLAAGTGTEACVCVWGKAIGADCATAVAAAVSVEAGEGCKSCSCVLLLFWDAVTSQEVRGVGPFKGGGVGKVRGCACV